MVNTSAQDLWAVILGGSSGFGLACAKRLAVDGLGVCIVHRDRRGAMEEIDNEFAQIKEKNAQFMSFNLDALSSEGRERVIQELHQKIGPGKVRLLLHSIAFGSLKLLAARANQQSVAVEHLAEGLGRTTDEIQHLFDELFVSGTPQLFTLASAPRYQEQLLLDDEELSSTIYAMGTSLWSWTKGLFDGALFAPDARVIGITSEGNSLAWLGYAAVSAAKAALEALSRSIAKEFGPYGIRSNIIQPGVTDTRALRLIPGSAQMLAQARLRNPLGRVTRVEDVAKIVSFLSSDDAAWINGALLRADGGEHIAGI